ncbi:hypothetical protein PoB_000565900 [Plakobranchus ocellatus]|uniref:Uncharacterized protein n=1 Tax=Plakobranchus ocellatus TaxID=259542 RepID=A0AAV3Y8A2_9GAST|nr:hypothetical protein PoB_000565900 [Plakobranchus ocellatus]
MFRILLWLAKSTIKNRIGAVTFSGCFSIAESVDLESLPVGDSGERLIEASSFSYSTRGGADGVVYSDPAQKIAENFSLSLKVGHRCPDLTRLRKSVSVELYLYQLLSVVLYLVFLPATARRWHRASESALRSAWTLLCRVRALLPVPGLTEGMKPVIPLLWFG